MCAERRKPLRIPGASASLTLTLGLLAATLATAVRAEPRIVYRCVSPEGTVVFSDRACGPDARPLELPDAPVVSNPRATPLETPPHPSASPDATSSSRSTPQSRVPGLDCPDDDAIKRAIHDHRVVLCMTVDEVRAAEPMRYNEHTVREYRQPDGRVLQEWIYRFHYTTWPHFIWFSDGYVVQIQG